MRTFEVTFPSLNSQHYSKKITALVVAPEKISPDTGAMLFTHGWGGNRFQHQDKMEYACQNYNLVCVAAEYRQSGYDFDPVSGAGSYVPYDASFYQVIDSLGALRFVLETYQLDGCRIYHYGGSQGGQICLLSSIYAPNTFAGIYASCPLTHLDESKIELAGRHFSPAELAARDAILHAERINCPVFLEHGTADTVVNHETHTKALADKLEALGKQVLVRYYEGGEHDLQPATTKLEAFKAMVPKLMECRKDNQEHDFNLKGKVLIPCGEKTLVVDWSCVQTSTELLRFV
ncbi:MAG: prolyl oligopeptidase family serine peptidase [Firmicutes bacterium]|jgi:predicted esterase|nr:prolyl oligopeptidase family serine peptidase [Bacillota bacterium]HQD39654.1 prolyl oligopeptidase family serine peptidase [Bacillota bacterium]